LERIFGMNRNQIAWWFWAGGTVLIVLSWANAVTATIGWIGFGIGLIGSVIGWGIRPPQNNTHEERLRDEIERKD
jgi:hypothetical protein